MISQIKAVVAALEIFHHCFGISIIRLITIMRMRIAVVAEVDGFRDPQAILNCLLPDACEGMLTYQEKADGPLFSPGNA